MDFLLCILVALVLFVTVFSLRKQKDALNDFERRIQLIESFMSEFDCSEED